MTSREVFISKLAYLRSQLSLLERYLPYSREELEANPDLRGAVERYIFLAIQSAIDLADIFLALKHLPQAGTMASSFETLRDREIVAPELASRLIAMVGFRNILVHGYQRIEFRFVDEALRAGRSDIVALAEALEEEL